MAEHLDPVPMREPIAYRDTLLLPPVWVRWLDQCRRVLTSLVGAHPHSSLWRWTTATSGAPAQGDVGVNNATYLNATEVRLSTISTAGLDVTGVLRVLASGDTLYLQDQGDSTRSVRYRLTGPAVNQGTYYTVPVLGVVDSGTPIANNQVVNVTAVLD